MNVQIGNPQLSTRSLPRRIVHCLDPMAPVDKDVLGIQTFGAFLGKSGSCGWPREGKSDQLQARIDADLKVIQRSPKLVRSFFRAPSLAKY